MRIYKKTINGVKVTAYNDSGVEWMVQAGNMETYGYPIKKFSMKEAMEFAAEVAAETKPVKITEIKKTDTFFIFNIISRLPKRRYRRDFQGYQVPAESLYLHP